jgi:drug/metabolite transporter (DMT)-like permease
MHVLAGLVAAFGTAVLYASAVALQALEARKVPREHSLRPSLLTRLLRRPLWLLGTALAAAGWAAQVGALLLIPLTLVEPTLAVSLVVLLGFGVRVLGEPVGRREVVSVAAVTAGIGLLAWASPARDPNHDVGIRLALSVGLLAAIALVPYALSRLGRSPGALIAVGAGVAYAIDGLATKFFSDDVSGRAWLGLALWFAAMLGAAAVGTLSEMSALQARPATQVAPIVLALTTLIPVALAPALAGETWSSSAWAQTGLVAAIVLIVSGAASLARSTAVGSVLEAEARKSLSETPRSDSAESSPATRLSVASADGSDESRVTTTTSPA